MPKLWMYALVCLFVIKIKKKVNKYSIDTKNNLMEVLAFYRNFPPPFERNLSF